MTTVLVFAKTPAPGRVKTRLCPPLSPVQAAALHRRLVIHTLETATLAGIGPVILYGSPDLAHPFFQRCARDYGIALRPQSDGDLGRRMSSALDQHLVHGGGALLIGCDCPALTADDLVAAEQALQEGFEAVLVPAEDGGYALIGLRCSQPGLFTGIDWGSPTVLEATRTRLRDLRLSWTELPTRWDVDRPEDLVRLSRAYPGLAVNGET
ncbi:MAG: TIGR04282 family arsenosugar biosynthesis glycosyltransferase [Pseudomonadota bacterium]